MFGRRGQIVWKKNRFVGGGGRRDYDAFLGVGLLVPLYLTTPIHTFGWGEESNYAYAIPLRPDRVFLLRTYVTDWCGPLCLLSGLAFLPLLCSGVNLALTIVCFLLLVASGIALLLAVVTAGTRDRNIRLVLGRHDWGSSDPATWHEDLLDRVVDPQKRLGFRSFERMAEAGIDEGRWAEAMWAARFCVALEDEEVGESLTNEILLHPKVEKRLARAIANPRERNDAFGDPIPLSDWVRGDPDAVVFQVAG